CTILYIDHCYIPMLYARYLYVTHCNMYPCYYVPANRLHTYINMPLYKHRIITPPLYCAGLYIYSYIISRAITDTPPHAHTSTQYINITIPLIYLLRPHMPLYYVVYGTYIYTLIYPLNMYALI